MSKFLVLAAVVAAGFFAVEFVFPGIKTHFRTARTSMRLSMLPSNEYIVVSDIPLGYDGKTSLKLDYAIVSVHGIFVIQEKPIGGRIFGEAKSERWTRQVLGKGYAFKNPLIKSARQISVLSSTLGLEPSAFIPVILFSGGGSAWVDTPVHIVPGFKLKKTIRSHTEQRLSFDQVQDAAIKLGEMD